MRLSHYKHTKTCKFLKHEPIYQCQKEEEILIYLLCSLSINQSIIWQSSIKYSSWHKSVNQSYKLQINKCHMQFESFALGFEEYLWGIGISLAMIGHSRIADCVTWRTPWSAQIMKTINMVIVKWYHSSYPCTLINSIKTSLPHITLPKFCSSS